MESCCVLDCDSYKQTAQMDIGYFKFPLHNTLLLNKWLRQIDRLDWKPSDISQICSLHFREEEIDWHTSRKFPILSPTAVPTMYPVEKKITRNMRRTSQAETILKSGTTILKNNVSEKSKTNKNDDFKPHRNKVTSLKQNLTMMPVEAKCNRQTRNSRSRVGSQLRKLLTKSDFNSAVQKTSSLAINKKNPSLKVTKNKTCNISSKSSDPTPFETVFLPDHGDENDVSEIVKVEDEVWVSQTYPCPINKNSLTIDHSSYSKSVPSNTCNKTYELQKVLRQCTDNKLKQKDSPSVLTTRRSDLKNVSQDHIYSHPSANRFKSLNSNIQQDSDQLRKRLEELKVKRQREQLKVVRLQIHLKELETKIKENNHEEILLPNLREGRAARKRSNWLVREKEEYEKLLKDVREIKLKLLRQRHKQELEKIRNLQLQMINLGKEMKENDRKQIAVLSNSRRSTNSSEARPEWMRREEEEFEKLLQDVRRVKQNYILSKSKQNSAKLDCSEVSSDEDCVIIETIQKINKLTKESKNNNRLTHKIGDGINPMDNKNKYSGVIGGTDKDYGEIIGVIDEYSIDVNMDDELPLSTINEELPDPGLLEV